MKATTIAQNVTATEPEYEFGIKYFGNEIVVTDWGYVKDPRTSGVIDGDGEIYIDGSFHEVLEIGKRLKSPELWEKL